MDSKLLQTLCAAQDFTCRGQKCASTVGELGASAIHGQQFHANLLLQARHGIADGRLAAIEARGGLCKAAFFDDGL